jgi:hypothetical protein
MRGIGEFENHFTDDLSGCLRAETKLFEPLWRNNWAPAEVKDCKAT